MALQRLMPIDFDKLKFLIKLFPPTTQQIPWSKNVSVKKNYNFETVKIWPTSLDAFYIMDFCAHTQ